MLQILLETQERLSQISFQIIIFEIEISDSGIFSDFCLKSNSKKSSQFQKFKKFSQVLEKPFDQTNLIVQVQSKLYLNQDNFHDFIH